MKRIIALLLPAFSMPAQAHESLVPHVHPHGLSMLPGIDAIIWTLLALVVALIAYWRIARAP
ncbi:hypothetical protein [Bradyrhizobium tropiciagri]|uniref:hypothetical protein n=1 Tax=Bradyrhizobium tropiciagri TaxID=312253 RepID=UPI00067BBEE1|nr:hypothetical protein [Bradyrhizobium tropiciagri]